MSLINPYLMFNGNCLEAFNFYKSVFGGEFITIQKFKDLPPSEDFKIDTKLGDRIMHISLPINKEKDNVLMGCDSNPEYGEVPVVSNVTLSFSADSKSIADKVFSSLSEGGKVSMPLADTFWGSYFGMCEDKFGTSWMVSFDKSK
jgi:PhnB protein